MAIKSILLPLCVGADEKLAIDSGLSVARMLRAHLDAVFIRPDPEDAYVYTGMLHSDAGAKDVKERLSSVRRTAASRSRGRFDRACQKSGVHKTRKVPAQAAPSARWQDVVDEAALVLPGLASATDLAIFAGELSTVDLLLGNCLETTLLDSGTPILYLPNVTGKNLFHRPLIAWNGSAACTRAISAWLALGTNPEQVMAVNIFEPDVDAPDMSGLSQRLAWHGIDISIESRRRSFDTVADMLCAAARDFECGMIVMGGYGRRRYAEALFGGVTRRVIRNGSLPVLMMH